ncbi:MAG: hypothetical protein H6559_34535 [Lewinellaceae bacterium]|nr:hypothetical protein [Lewinellaceae bacterium]
MKTFSLPEGFSALKYLYLGITSLKKRFWVPDQEKLEILHLRNNRLRNLPQEVILVGWLEALYCA